MLRRGIAVIRHYGLPGPNRISDGLCARQVFAE